MNQGSIERSRGADICGGKFTPNVAVLAAALGRGFYHIDYREPLDQFRDQFIKLRTKLKELRSCLVQDLAAQAQAQAAIIEQRLAGIPQRVVWADSIENVWCLEGMEALLTHALKGSSYTSAAFIGLIESTGYGYAGANGSGVDKDNLASAITAVGGASPANGWNEAPSSTVATRGTPSFGTASSSGVNSDLACTAIDFSTLEGKTIKGCFLLLKTKAGVSPTSAVGNTAGALLSAGLFTGGDQTVSGAGTLSVTYTSRLVTT